MAERKHGIESLSETHKKERKELQAKIQNLKHGVAKGDKKKKKEIAAEIAVLEAELTAKHASECDAFNTPQENQYENDNQSSCCIPTDEGNAYETQCTSSENCAPQRVSKAQKRRFKKASKAKEREEVILQQEIENLSGARHVESEKLNKILSSRGLSIYEVPSDGDCLYKSVEHQLFILKLQNTTVKQLRTDTSTYMLQHRDDFIPFLINSKSENMSNEQYEEYCYDIIKKPTWGGQVEIEALSHVCSVPIEVIQADGPSIITGEAYSTAKLILSYHRHMYGLGEHYNSVIKKVEDS